MLTPNDIHFLVGILCKISTPDNVDIILGDMIQDIASKNKRDVDITISYKNLEGKTVSFVGLEIKDKSRKLGSQDIEQLCQKFKDMPAFHEGGIVSASGYSKPAINKADYHGIKLYELVKWNVTSKDLEHIQFPENFSLNEITYDFAGSTVIFNFERELTDREKMLFSNNLPVLSSPEDRIENITNLEQLGTKAFNTALQNDVIKKQLDCLKIGQSQVIKQPVYFRERLIVIIDKNEIVIKNAKIILNAKKIINTKPVEFKKLIKFNDPGFCIGSAITELSNGLVLVFVTSKMDKSLKIDWIPVPERLKNKIYKRKIK